MKANQTLIKNCKKIYKSDKWAKVLLLGMVANFMMLGFAIYSSYDGCDSCKLYNTEAKFGLNGAYYFEDEYYCVWTKGKTFQEINDTEHHEVCHALIDGDEYHFCESWKKDGTNNT